MTRLAINGAAGRMGQRLVALAHENADVNAALTVAAALEAPGHPLQGKDAGEIAGVGSIGVAITDQLGAGVADVVIDFTLPVGFRAALATCVATGTPLVVGTTGLTEADHAAIDEAGKSIAILQAPNMSLGVNLLFALAGQVAATLGDDYDIEIVEAHHRFKVDAPSGTAFGIAEAVCEATGKDINKTLVHGREGGDAERQRGEIGMHSMRTGDVVGRHTISFGTLGEELQLGHIASTRDVFAHGALKAAKWLAGKSPGRYTMKDVLGL